jgi:hypothetical protein
MYKEMYIYDFVIRILLKYDLRTGNFFSKDFKDILKGIKK